MSVPETDKMLVDLFDVAEDYEADVLSDLLLRAGFTWKCEAVPDPENPDAWACGYRNPADAERCEDCLAPRPEPERVCASGATSVHGFGDCAGPMTTLYGYDVCEVHAENDVQEMARGVATLSDGDLDREVSFAEGAADPSFPACLWSDLVHREQEQQAAADEWGNGRCDECGAAIPGAEPGEVRMCPADSYHDPYSDGFQNGGDPR